MPEGKWRDLQFRMHHDEDAKLYVDGVLATRVSGYVTAYEAVSIKPKARELLKPGKHILAVHCKQTAGGQYIDVGIVDLLPDSGQAAADPKLPALEPLFDFPVRGTCICPGEVAGGGSGVGTLTGPPVDGAPATRSVRDLP